MALYPSSRARRTDSHTAGRLIRSITSPSLQPSQRSIDTPFCADVYSRHVDNCLIERRNNDQIVKGGTLTQRLVKRQEVELGIKKREQDIGTQVHLVADVEHSDLLNQIFENYVVDDLSVQLVLRGAEESLAIERCFHGAVATTMAELD